MTDQISQLRTGMTSLFLFIIFVVSLEVASASADCKIVFISQQDGNKEIYSIDPDGRNSRNLTNHAGHESDFDVSPDCSKVAFVSGRDGNKEIYVIGTDGRGLRNLSRTDLHVDEHPEWSPDGTKIYFKSTRDGNSEIYVMNADGSGQRNLTGTAHHEQHPLVSPDGRSVAYWSRRPDHEDQELYVMETNGRDQRRLTRTDFPVVSSPIQWSPDSGRLLFQVTLPSEQGGIWTVNADGSGTARLLQGKQPDISPDGRKIAYTGLSLITHGNADIYVVDSDGTNQQRLTATGQGEDSPEWSPDGDKIAFTASHGVTDAAHGVSIREVYVMNANGSGATRLTHTDAHNAGLMWSPNHVSDTTVDTSLKRFFMRFQDAYLTFQPGTGKPQISAQGNVLSYGSDWEVKQMKPYLFHMRQRFWKGFYWKVNTSRNEVYRVRGTFGQYGGGQEQVLDVNVESTDSAGQTRRVTLRFPKALLVYQPGKGNPQISAQGNVLSYGSDWEVKQMKPYLFHMRQRFWKGFYWKVNTSRNEVYRVKGTFGQYGGQEQALDIQLESTN